MTRLRIAAFAALLTAMSSFSRTPAPHSLGEVPAALSNYLELTPEQIQAIRVSNIQFNVFYGQQQVRLEELKAELGRLRVATPFDADAVGRVQAQRESILRALTDRMEQVRKTALALLTLTQANKLKALEEVVNLQGRVSEAICAGLLTGSLPDGGNAVNAPILPGSAPVVRGPACPPATDEPPKIPLPR